MIKQFETQDIYLASFLKVKGMKLINIVPGKRYNAVIIFEEVSQELINEWVSGNAIANAKEMINEYRHIKRQCSIVSKGTSISEVMS